MANKVDDNFNVKLEVGMQAEDKVYRYLILNYLYTLKVLAAGLYRVVPILLSLADITIQLGLSQPPILPRH